MFLATVIDCYTKAVVGWAMDDNYKTPLIVAAINMAARNHDLKPGAIFHSDYAEVFVKPRNPGLATLRGLACVDPRLNDRVCHRRL